MTKVAKDDHFSKYFKDDFILSAVDRGTAMMGCKKKTRGILGLEFTFSIESICRHPASQWLSIAKLSRFAFVRLLFFYLPNPKIGCVGHVDSKSGLLKMFHLLGG